VRNHFAPEGYECLFYSYQSKAKSKKQVAAIQSSILDLEDAIQDVRIVPILAKCCRWMLLTIFGLGIQNLNFISMLMMLPERSLVLTLIHRKP